MSTPPALQAALSAYNKTYDVAFEKAMRKFDGMVWYDPSEAERKAIVAKQRKGRELAYAPTGSALEAGKLMKMSDYQNRLKENEERTAAAAINRQTAAATAVAAEKLEKTASIPVPQPSPIKPAPEAAAPAEAPAIAAAEDSKKPFWKFW